MSMNAVVMPLTHALRTVLTQMEILCAVAQVATDLAVTASLVKVIGIQCTHPPLIRGAKTLILVQKLCDSSCKWKHRSQKSS